MVKTFHFTFLFSFIPHLFTFNIMDHQSQAKATGVTKPSLRMDSQVKYGILSRGEAARVFMRFPPESYREKIWDHAAGISQNEWMTWNRSE